MSDTYIANAGGPLPYILNVGGSTTSGPAPPPPPSPSIELESGTGLIALESSGVILLE